MKNFFKFIKYNKNIKKEIYGNTVGCTERNQRT